MLLFLLVGQWSHDNNNNRTMPARHLVGLTLLLAIARAPALVPLRPKPTVRTASGRPPHTRTSAPHRPQPIAVGTTDQGTTWLRQSREDVASDSDRPTDTTSSSSILPTEWRGQVLRKLKNVIDPDLGSDIVTLGFVQNLQWDEGTRTVRFQVELTTPACPVKDQFAADCERLVLELPFVDSVQVEMTAQPTTSDNLGTLGMNKVGAVIAVSSCKGGVGKSTTAVNLAYTLQALGATVGILDADVYGPSLPTMVKPDDDVVRFVGRQIAPLQRNGVRLMSFGYINDGSAVMRGPMVTQLLDQILSVTHWGTLDYLILDMPPGTGDIQLTLTQRLNITAAVIVTTPQELSFADVVRGIEMFDSVNVPAVAVVENMAYYEIEEEGTSSTTPAAAALDQEQLKQAMVQKLRDEGLELNGGSTVEKLASELVELVVQQSLRAQNEAVASITTKPNKRKVPIFGPGHKQRLSEQFGIEHTFSMPLLQTIAANGDSGTPFVLEHPHSPQAAIFQQLAGAVVSEVAKSKFAGPSNGRPSIVYDKEDRVLVVDEKERLAPATLRRECRCAACVEEMTGRQLLIKTQVPDSVKPLKLYPTGNYALSVDWSDGHRSLYPYRLIRSILLQQQQQQQQETQKQSETVTAPEKEQAAV